MDKAKRLAYEGTFFALAVALLLIWAVRVAESWHELRASIIIFFLGSIGAVLALLQVALDVRSMIRQTPTKEEGISFDAPAIESESRWGNVEVWGWLLGFYILIRLIGFILAVPLFVFAYARTYGARWYLAAILAVGSWAFIYGTFDILLHVPWPEPILPWLVTGFR